MLNNVKIFLASAVLSVFAACTVDSPKSRMIMAERLWNNGSHAAAVQEFEVVYQRDLNGQLGLQALLRSATTQTLFLGQHKEAITKFNTFLEKSSDESLKWDVQKQIGNILYENLENYEESIRHFQRLIRFYPKAVEIPEFKFKVGKSYFFLSYFDEAIESFRDLDINYGGSIWGEKALLEMAKVYFTRGNSGNAQTDFEDAQRNYEKFLEKYPASSMRADALYGIATCFEEKDQLEVALKKYQEIENIYPSPKVIQIKMIRIKERLAQRNLKVSVR